MMVDGRRCSIAWVVMRKSLGDYVVVFVMFLHTRVVSPFYHGHFPHLPGVMVLRVSPHDPPLLV